MAQGVVRLNESTTGGTGIQIAVRVSRGRRQHAVGISLSESGLRDIPHDAGTGNRTYNIAPLCYRGDTRLGRRPKNNTGGGKGVCIELKDMQQRFETEEKHRGRLRVRSRAWPSRLCGDCSEANGVAKCSSAWLRYMTTIHN